MRTFGYFALLLWVGLVTTIFAQAQPSKVADSRTEYKIQASRERRHLQQEGEGDPLDSINRFIQSTQKKLVFGDDSSLSAGIVLQPPNMVTIPKAFATSSFSDSSQSQQTVFSNDDHQSADSFLQQPTRLSASTADSGSARVLPVQPPASSPTNNSKAQTLTEETKDSTNGGNTPATPSTNDIANTSASFPTTNQPDDPVAEAASEPSPTQIVNKGCLSPNDSRCAQCTPPTIRLDDGRCITIPSGCRTFDMTLSKCLACDFGLTLSKNMCS